MEQNGGQFWLLLGLAVVAGAWPALSCILALRQFDQKKAEWDTPRHVQLLATWRYATWVATRKLMITWGLLFAIAIVAGIQLLSGLPKSIDAAGLIKNEVWQGQWWRLCTAPFLHGSIMHVAFNGMALLGLGRLSEVLGSRSHLALVFAVSALGGSLFSLVFLPRVNSVGASGGLMGLIAFLLILGLRRKSCLPPGFVKSFVINIAIIADCPARNTQLQKHA